MFFDANATTEMLAPVAFAIAETAAKGPLNASSAHSQGALARRLLAGARESICVALGYDDPENIIFVSSGTEANNIVVNGFYQLNGSIITSAVEHASIAAPALAAGSSTTIPVGPDGVIKLNDLAKALSERSANDIVLVCVQAANSETGVLQPLEQVAALCRASAAQVYLHVDAAQAFGRIRLSTEFADSISFSGHKLHGPTGTGFLWMSDRLSDVLPRTILGGGQERGFRSGTQNVPGIVGLGVAVAERLQDFHSAVSKLAGLRGRFEDRLLKEIPDTKVICSDSPRLPNTSNVMFRGADADTLLAQLDAEGVICSNGSACSSMKPSASPVLRAVGLSEREAFQCLRFSFSVLNTIEEVDRAIPLIVEAVARVRAYK